MRLVPAPAARIQTMVARENSQGWTETDFVDSASPDPRESDPWDPSASLAPYDADPEPPDFESNGTDAPLPDGGGWDLADELLGVDEGVQWEDGDPDPGDWAEPDPLVDASSELSESLYPPDDSITDVSRELKIGELLVRFDPVSPEQQARCHELLSACGIGRLRRWIPWLRARSWCGATLQLFLEFRHHWESGTNVKWWETFTWDAYQQRWHPRYQAETLTLDHCCELLEKRQRLTVNNVIDPAWFPEWEKCAAWKLGVRSFASFAVFRAGMSPGEDWLGHLIRADRRTAMELAQCADASYAPFMLPSYAQQYGFPLELAARPSSLHGDPARLCRDIIDRFDGLLS